MRSTGNTDGLKDYLAVIATVTIYNLGSDITGLQSQRRAQCQVWQINCQAQAVLLRDTKTQITRFSFSMINNVSFSLPLTLRLFNFQHIHTFPAYVDL